MKELALITLFLATAQACAIKTKQCKPKTFHLKDTVGIFFTSATRTISSLIAAQFDKTTVATDIDPARSSVDASAGGALYYRAWSYLNTEASAAVTAPPSPPNVIGTAAVSQDFRGQPALLPLNSSITAFQLQSLCLLCFTSTGARAFQPVGCTVQVAGVDEGGRTHVQELTFTPARKRTRYACAAFPRERFGGLVRADLQLLQSVAAEEEATVVAFDDVTYTADVKTC